LIVDMRCYGTLLMFLAHDSLLRGSTMAGGTRSVSAWRSRFGTSLVADG
jgi:hypothetical protein